jgi:hypothetical protein
LYIVPITNGRSPTRFCSEHERKIMEPKPQPKFVAVKDFVYRGSQLIARVVSHTMARRIANALNIYKPKEKGY